MFTGLIEEIGRVARVTRAGDGLNLTIEAGRVLEGTRIGDSICINGACQTVTAIDARSFTVFVSSVTAEVTTLGDFAPGRRVNLERAMTPSSRFGGHFVQGHVDGRGSIESIEKDRDGNARVGGGRPGAAALHRGKGIDRRRRRVAHSGFSHSAPASPSTSYPETMSGTIISEWKTGDRVNIETDILAKYVERMLRSA